MRTTWLVYVLCVLVSFVLMRFGFGTTSVSMHWRADYDLNIYYLIGNGWMRGLIPYVALADLKGPLVFLLHGVCSLVTPGSFLGICVANALLVGLGLLFAYKTARLFLPWGAAAAVLGAYLYFLLYFAANPAEQVWTLQHVTLYMLLRWATGQAERFRRSEMVFLGAAAAVVLLLKFNLVAFWAPVCVLALFLNGWRALLWMASGFTAFMLPVVCYFWWQGALPSLWREYVGMALAYGRVPWAESALCTRNFALFRGVMPWHLYSRLPDWLLAAAGCLPCVLWPMLWFRKSLPLRKASLWVLVTAFVLLAYTSYSGRYDFLHYAFVFFPFCLLSLILVAAFLQRRYPRLLLVAGAGVALLIMGTAVSLPLYVKYGRTYNGNDQMRESAKRIVAWLQAMPREDVFVLDAGKSLHLYRLSGRLPSIPHFIPPFVPGGAEMRRAEQLDYIRTHAPRYLLGSAWNHESELELIRRSGVPYTVSTHRQLGLPAYPAHARQPEIMLYTRLDDTGEIDKSVK